ncbi:DTW domain-containing protein [Shewanella eurypsychrophilus]|uniref:tRNA-uridine aminocarboxypropyltransferase n=1 Tax=Shewanella eurypsychrophilus TaxID=2593656 RepID=A0ABX6V357_9GAMM|nr:MULTISPECIES: tRNA-uridine aminocarboxypropyltransferase [Shewanella]QFU20654.1 DTW domain-containing protein [Shewanella sp. YLB-09]QFU20934.1 DTW domain-containing protein [Shewanella sp. YLB-09]QPG56222.1 DTW domain-containing protein [Shewanella eurypsychrophilus]
MSRPNCPKCHYPLKACLCESIEQMHVSTELIILQDPSEVGHAKNSVRLLSLVIPETQVIVGELPEDFLKLRQYLNISSKPIYLVYPSDKSRNVEEVNLEGEVILLLLDGTWRKAYKLLQLNPWLLDYPSLHLDLESASNYTIRKASRSDSLSTLEASAMMLQAIEPKVNVTPLTKALRALVDQRLNAMPAEVRKRYQ